MSTVTQWAWLIPVFPLAAFLVLIALGRASARTAVFVSTAAGAASFALAVAVAAEYVRGAEDYTYEGPVWLRLGDTALRLGFELNRLNALMIVVVATVSLLVLVYSAGYMRGDPRIGVYYAYVSLFSASMFGLVMSAHLVQLYVFWELVGLGSFLLIGFWYAKPEAKAAAKKAFVMTRIGDAGLLAAILLLFWNMPDHALDFTSLHNAFADGRSPVSEPMTTLIALLVFLGAVGKSAQLPLHTWLPDAMEGPTPISALIHAATMVAAGVYLVARMYDLFLASPEAMAIVAYIGAVTALMAATVGAVLTDIKRVLAFSTVSQLGYMMMALGAGAYAAGVFHLFTHAFFKALLFLAAGSVIHAVHTQDIREMGGLAARMRTTAATFAIGALALAGVFPLSGFWSKDAILASVLEKDVFLFAIGVTGSFVTAFYMARLFFLTFYGPRFEGGGKREPAESPAVMTVPLVALAVLSAVAGFVEWPTGWFDEWLGRPEGHESAGWPVMMLTTAVALAGIAAGWALYGSRRAPRRGPVGRTSALYRLLERKYAFDEIYEATVVRPVRTLAGWLAVLDERTVDGAVRAVAAATVAFGRFTGRLQNGQVQTYGVAVLIGLVALIAVAAGRGIWS